MAAWDPGYVVSSLAMGLLSGLVPVVSIEVYLAGMAALSGAHLVPVVAGTALGQMLAKAVLFRSAQGASGRSPARPILRARDALSRWKGGSSSAVAFSAVSGVPPFYATSIAAGLLELSFPRFLVAGTLGVAVRYSLIFALPRLFMS